MNSHQSSSRRTVVAFGLDVSKDKFHCAKARSDEGPFRPEDLKRMKVKAFDNTAEGASLFLNWAMAQVPEGDAMLIVMESTGSYSTRLAHRLLCLDGNLHVAVVDPRRPKAHAVASGVRNKTDVVDARVIATYGAEKQPVGDMPMEQIFRDLRAMVRTRSMLIDQRTALQNHLEMLCEEALSSPIAKQMVKSLRKSIEGFNKDIARFEEELKHRVSQDERVKRDIELLDTIPGVGFITAVTVISELGDLRRFRTSRGLVAKAGLNPEIKQSGKRVGQTHISKRGSAQVRATLYMSAVATLRTKSHFSEIYQHYVNQSGKLKLVSLVIIMRKILTVMRAIVVSGQPFKEPRLACGQLAETCVENP